jgi:hypothetical protein
MRKLSTLLGLMLTIGSHAVVAQQLVDSETGKVSGSASMLLNCQPLAGQVTNSEGEPLIGATLLVKGTSNAYITDGQGNFKITAPLYRKQVLAVEAAGYLPQLVTITSCALPVLALERDPAVRIKKSGKRAGQVVRYGDAYRQ